MAATEVVFPPFRLDLVEKRLWRDARVVPLRPKTLAVLCYLVERPGRFVSSDELLDAIWPGIAVSEVMPRLSIRELRRALGDDPRQPRIIETTPRRGYRFIATVGGNAALPDTDRFVGRTAELALLHSRLASVREGRGQVVGISGDAGIGKSRLLAEFRRALAGHDVHFLQGHCVAYGTSMPGLPVVDLVRQHCGISETGRPEDIPFKIRDALKRVDMDARDDAPFLLHLVGHGEGTEALSRFGPQTIKARTVEIVCHLLVRITRERALVVALEDLQWLDSTSAECFASLVEHLQGATLLLLTTYRSGFRPPWIEKSYVTQMALDPLSRQDSLAVLDARLPTASLPVSLVEEIVTRAEGNPFFLEELAKTVEERGEAHALAVPETVQRVLSARIERLPVATRALLNGAAVLGREFSRREIAAMLHESADVDGALEELQDAEFLYARGGSPDEVYRFKHVLTHDVAYAGLGIPERRALHAVAARTLETLYADRLDEVVGRLAHHYAHTDDADKAITYLTRRASKAARVYANTEAVEALRQALDHVERLPETERRRRRLDVSLQLAFSFTVLGRFPEVLDLLQPLEADVAQLQEPSLAGPYHFRLGMTYYYFGDQPRLRRHSERAIEAAGRSGDAATAGRAIYVLALDAFASGRFARGVEQARQAVARLTGTRDSHYLGLSYMIWGLNAFLSGDCTAGIDAETQVVRIGESVQDRRLQSLGGCTMGWLYAMMGDAQAGLAACERALQNAPDDHCAANALGYQGYAYLQSENASRALPVLERAVELNERLAPHQGIRFMLFLAEAYLIEGHLEKARAMAQRGYSRSRDTKAALSVALAQRTLGAIAQGERRWADAATQLTAALASFTAMSAPLEIARTHVALATLAHRRRDAAALTEQMTTAHRLFDACHVPRLVERTAEYARKLGVSLR